MTSNQGKFYFTEGNSEVKLFSGISNSNEEDEIWVSFLFDFLTVVNED